MIQLYHQIIHYDLRRTCYKITGKEKIKTIDKKIKQNKAQYDSDRQTAKISALSLRNVGIYEFLTDNDVLPEKVLLAKAFNIRY